MTSLAEAYEENVGEVGNERRLYLGVGLFATGALLVVAAMVTATVGDDLLAGFDVKYWQAKEMAGVLAGLGVPAVFVGIFTILPASERVRAAAAIGAGIAVLGVALFTNAYPYDWANHGQDLTLQVVAVYFLGVIVTFWCLFVAVANFKTRNDPGGTVTLEISQEGEVRTVEVNAEDLEDFEQLDELRAMQTELAAPGEYTDDTDRKPTGYGGVGFLGDVPMDETPTGAHASSDGGTAAGNDIRSPLDDPDAEGLANQRTTDTYCGNCKHFQYVRSGNGMQPHCGFYGRTMNDMDACEEWEPNS